MYVPISKEDHKDSVDKADSFLAGPNKGRNCERCIEDLANLLDEVKMLERAIKTCK